MKKIAFAAAVLFTLGLTSCSKDFTCTCAYNDGTEDVTTTTKFEDTKKGDATEACDDADAVVKIIDANGTCSLD